MSHNLSIRLHSLLVFVLLVTSLSAQISNVQLEEDLDFLKEQLELYHPNLYVYDSKEGIQEAFDKLKDQEADQLSEEEAFALVSSVYSIVKDGHIYFQPKAETLAAFYATSKLLPIDIHWNDDGAFLIRSYDVENQIIPGSKVISINGITASDIRSMIIPRVLRDGNNETYPEWLLNNFFRAFYTFFYGVSDTYEIIVESTTVEKNVLLKGMTHKAIGTARASAFPKYEEVFSPKQGLLLDIDRTTKVATITIRSFDNRILKKDYDQNFKKLIAQFFEEINNADIDHLILDLRDNQGGHVTNGIFLIQHLIDEPFQAVEGFSKVDKKNYNNDSRNRSVKGIGTGMNKPMKHPYKGKLYTLINGGSFSASGIVAHVLNKSNRGMLIGEETAGSAYTLVGEPNKEFTLPHSQIQVTIPTLQFVLQDYDEVQKGGTVPDERVVPTVEDIINGRDGVMEYVYSLLIADLLEGGH